MWFSEEVISDKSYLSFPRKSRAVVVNASIDSSYLWHTCKLFSLTKNMRLKASIDIAEQEKIKQFSEWLLQLRKGKLGNHHDGIADVEILNTVLTKDCVNPLHTIVTSTCPYLQENMFDSEYFTNRAIWAPTMEIVDQNN